MNCPFCEALIIDETKQTKECVECGASFQVHRTPDPPKTKKGK